MRERYPTRDCYRVVRLAPSAQGALCTSFSLLPTAYGKPPLVAAGFHFLGFSVAPPCTVGRLLPFPNSGFHGFLRIPRILTEL